MIVTVILYLLYGAIYVLTAPLRLLSDVSLPASFTSAVSTAAGYAASFNTLIPIDTLFQVLAAMAAVEVGVLAYKLIMWVVTKIPTISN